MKHNFPFIILFSNFAFYVFHLSLLFSRWKNSKFLVKKKMEICFTETNLLAYANDISKRELVTKSQVIAAFSLRDQISMWVAKA